MGGGIAQVAAVAGHEVILQDVDEAAVARARAGIDKALARETEKKRLTQSAADAARGRVRYIVSADLAAFAPCDVVIEAIVERLGPKRESFAALERVVAPEAMLATNTSALSITAIAGACQRPERVLGLHFFNPAPVMPLVEVVRGQASSRALVDAAGGVRPRWAVRRAPSSSAGASPPSSPPIRRASSSTGSLGRSTARRFGSWTRASR